MIFVHNLMQSDKPYMTTSGHDYRRVKKCKDKKLMLLRQTEGKEPIPAIKFPGRGEDSSANLALKLANELEK